MLSLLVGVNDRRSVPLEQDEQTYDKLLTGTKAANPKLKLVLCEPFIVDHLATTPQNGSPNADIVKRQEIVAKLAAKHEATKRAPAIHWIWNDVHPTYSGHQILADAWELAVRVCWRE